MSRTSLRRSLAAVLCAAAVLLAGACADQTTGTVASPTPAEPVAHRITIQDGQFIDRATGAVFVPRGVNYFHIVDAADRFFSPRVFDRDRIADEFAGLAAAGYNTVRIFLDGCNIGADCMTIAGESGLNPAYLDVIAEVMTLARDHDLVLLLTSNDLPDGGGYRDRAARDDSDVFPGYRNSDFLTASGHQAIADYWQDLLSGLAQRGAPFEAVLGWSILNEHWLFSDQPPLSLRSGTAVTAAGSYDLGDEDRRRAMVVDSTRALIATVAGVIRSQDPDALVTMGFFVPQFPHPTDIGGTWYSDTAPLVESSDLDFFDFHAYPGTGLSVAEHAENFGIDDSKPVVMGEVGAFVDRYPDATAAALAVQHWIADSCLAGFDGWIHWGYLRAPLADATWAFTDADGYLAEVLSPAAQPDPCAPALSDPNLAAGQPVTASQSLPEEPPEDAVDRDPDTQWGSGGDAPQWIEVELHGVTVTTVRLTVAQHPPGQTTHRVDLRTPDGTEQVHRFDGPTDAGEVLEVTLDEPVADVTAVRITTERSPSWVSWTEIEVE